MHKIVLFTYCKQNIYFYSYQKIAEWRPKYSVALITNAEDLQGLLHTLLTEKAAIRVDVKSIKLLYETDFVLRFIIEN